MQPIHVDIDLAEPDRLRDLVARLGGRATSCSVEHADHGFRVAASSGRTSAGAAAEALDALSSWVGAF